MNCSGRTVTHALKSVVSATLHSMEEFEIT